MREVEIITKEERPAVPEMTLRIASQNDIAIGGQSVVRKTSERKHDEETVWESEEKYRAILEEIQDGYYEVDLAGNLMFFNDSLCKILGSSRQRLQGLNNREYTDPRTAEKLYESFNRVYRTGAPIQGLQYEVIKQDGTKKHLEISVSLIKDSAGEPTGFRGVLRDITEHRHLEEQLRQSQKMDAIGRLAGGVAHDFNNLLTVINGYSELMLGKLGENHPLRRSIEEIKKAGDRAASLTRQLLAFSRKQVLQPKVLNLNTVLSDINRMLRRLIGEDIELVTVLSTDIGNLKADPGQIEQVILNLAINARDAMPQGGKLTIEAANVVLDAGHLTTGPLGACVMVAVSDTGCGMDEETMSHIFEPFFTTKENGKGTGLGLSTVYGIIKQSGGHISVISEPGRGTTFKIYLPRTDEPCEAIGSHASTAHGPSGWECVLLVEDEESLRKLISDILQTSGYRVLEAANADEALVIGEQYGDPIHMMMTDVVMPGISGLALSHCISPLRPEMKVLYMSGHVDQAVARHGIFDPEIPFLQKPFTAYALTRKVREVLDGPCL